MLYIGVDPDLHCLAVAGWYEGKPAWGFTVKAPYRKGIVENTAALEMIEALSCRFQNLPNFTTVAVEAQELKRSGNRQHKRPQDIVTLAQVAGAVLGAVAASGQALRLLFPKPSEWKGDVEKAAMQASLYTDLGWGYDLVRPRSRSKLPGRPPAKAEYAVPLRPLDSFNVDYADWKHIGVALLLARWASRQTK
jgi:hypothetical protein